ncbi:MAG: hypothetical protein K0S51_241 [Bacillales bacterium]|nr:hypothetical protein [Bacillales bacterium]
MIIGTIIFRTILFYILILIIFRVMGKREIAELNILDLVVYMMIAELVVVSIEQYDNKIIYSIVPVLALTVIQVISAILSLKSKKFRDIVEGYPTIIIENGKIKEKEMRKIRYNLDDLLLQLRAKDVMDICDVKFAILEPSGDLSIVKNENTKNQKSLSIPLIMDGEIVDIGLKKLNKNQEWLESKLKEKGFATIDDVFYCSVTDGCFYIDGYE